MVEKKNEGFQDNSLSSNNSDLHSRIKKIVGQINAIDRMIDKIDDKAISCEEVLMQVKAAKNALHSIGKIILEQHIKHCVREGIESNNNIEQAIQSFATAVKRFFDI